MKYFTKELWAAGNSRREGACDWSYEQGKLNTEEYYRQLERLRPRLSEEAYGFFTAEDVHDGRLLEFAAGDGVAHDASGPAKFDINAHKTSARIKLLGPNLDVLYTLKYTKVRRVVFDYPTSEPLFHSEGRHIGDWGYHELTPADDRYLRHEILFASGTTILIAFRHFSFKRESCEGTRFQALRAGDELSADD